MGKITSFRDLIVWQKSHILVVEIYKITKGFPREETYVLTSQMRRAAISIASNIVEGFNRKTMKESLQFYNTANGSLHELEYQLLLARDLKYITEKDYEVIQALIDQVSKLLYGWSKSQKANLANFTNLA